MREPWVWAAVVATAAVFGGAACSSSSDSASPAGSAGASGQEAAAGSGGGNAGTEAAGGAADTVLSGSLGDLGALQPTVSSLYISNSGETLVYLSSAPITCELLLTSRWLGSAPVDAQVVELVVKGAPVLGPIEGEVNYAKGGKSSAYETGADTDTITFTESEPDTLVAGTVEATYEDGSKLQGTFRATFCPMGQGY
jgi:hypothetical protein